MDGRKEVIDKRLTIFTLGIYSLLFIQQNVELVEEYEEAVEVKQFLIWKKFE